jgi:mycofactocin precursor
VLQLSQVPTEGGTVTTVPVAPPPVAEPDETPPDDDRLVESDELVEDVSIDGMCGVY